VRCIGRNGIELLSTLLFAGSGLLIFAAVIESFELFNDEIKSILLNIG
jgi:hypothetical protein